MEDHRFLPIIGLLERSSSILLVTHRKPDGDAVGSIMGLYKALKLLGKTVIATCADTFPEQFHFLPGLEDVKQEVTGNRDFIVTLDCDKTEVDRLKYQLEDNKIHIVITPKNGRFVKQNVSFSEQGVGIDLIITVDVAAISQLGKVYEENTELFAQIPVVNIDHHVSNPGFGKLNLIDTAACSTAEILYRLIKAMEAHFKKSLVTPDVATFLLSGIETDTGSFQNANTTPRAMEIAADLMDSGARQQEIIRYLFRTKKLSTLKLWGSILNKLEVDVKHRLVWSSISQADLTKTGSRMEDSGEIIDELLVHAPEAEIVVLFKEDAGMVTVSFRSKTHEANVAAIAGEFGGGGHVKAAGAKFPGKGLQEIMTKVLAALFDYQKKRLKLEGEGSAATAEPKITQVLEGYTTVAEKKPSLEQRAFPKPPPSDSSTSPQQTAGSLGMTQVPPVIPTELKGPGGGRVEESRISQKDDIHHKTKAAIMAEQSQPTNGTPFAPSKLMKPDDRRKQEKRFTDEIPGYMRENDQKKEIPNEQNKKNDQREEMSKKREMPNDQISNAQKKADEGVKVFFAPPKAPVPEIPKKSGPPTVRPAPAALPTPPKDPNVPKAPNSPPPPPKDPFSIGDDGFTDIERALGNL